MKVTLPKDYKEIFTMAQLEAAKQVIAQEKDQDEETPAGWAKMAIAEEGSYPEKILEATATICRNCRIWNQYTDESRDLDVWIEATAKTTEGFMEIGAYLTDIWQSGAKPYKNQMYIVKYTRSK